MSKQVALRNVAVEPTFSVAAVGSNLTSIRMTDGQGGEVNLTLPSSNAKAIASAISGSVRAQTFAALEAAEAAGTIDAKGAKRLKEMRDNDARLAEGREKARLAREAKQAAEGKGRGKVEKLDKAA